MKHQKLSVALVGLTSVLAVSPAWADGGTHGHTTFANIMHWLSSPTHSLFAVIGGAVFVAAAYKMSRKRRA